MNNYNGQINKCFAIDSAIKKSPESYIILYIFSLSSSEFLINYLLYYLKNIIYLWHTFFYLINLSSTSSCKTGDGSFLSFLFFYKRALTSK